MSVTAGTPLRLVTFGDRDGLIWGGLLDAGTAPAFVLGCGDIHLTAAAGTLALDSAGDTWTISGDGIALSITRAGDRGPNGNQAGGAELGTASGSVTVDGAAIAVDCPATRSADPEPGVDRLGSLRSVSGWFGPELALSLQSVRGLEHRDHADDVMRAMLFEPDGPRPVEEPRLSTTVGEDGYPVRTSVELWVGEGDELHPRRAAGEASGAGARVTAGGMELAGVPLRCHAAGLEGTGVYLLARFS